MDNAANLDNITVCRFCLQNTGSISVFSSSHPSGSSSYCDQAMCIANVKIQIGDGLPSTVCDPCVVLLESSLAFKLLVESSALKLGVRALERGQLGNAVRKEEFRSDDEAETFECSDLGDGSEFDLEEKVKADLGSEETGKTRRRLSKCEYCRKTFRSVHRRKKHLKICAKKQLVVATTASEEDCDVKTEEVRIGADCKEEMESNLVELSERSSSLHLLRSCPVLEDGIAEGLQQFLARSECQNCKKYFNSGRGLKIHLAKCMGRRKRKKSVNKNNGSIHHSNSVKLDRNSNRSSLKENERSHMCESCGHAFKSRSVLRQHMRTHDAPRTAHSCQRCGKMFTRVAHLVAHHRIHDNVKPYICETCGRGFTKSSDLYRHRRVHSDSRSFPCTLCGKLFKRSGDVVVHMRAHTGNRPFQCGLCDKNYKSHSSLKKHKKHHAAEAGQSIDTGTLPMNVTVLGDSQKEMSSPEKRETVKSREG